MTITKEYMDNRNFSEDEIACLKKMVYEYRQRKITELYINKTYGKTEEERYSALSDRIEDICNRTTVTGTISVKKINYKKKSFLDKVKDFFKGISVW